jgi:GNAT superfamily N-acetyltransferase
MTMAPSVTYNEFAFDSDTYPKEVRLREKVLRAPLGLCWEPHAFEAEERSVHIGGFVDGELIATVVLKPVDKQTVKMRQFAVEPAFQSKGVGSGLLKFAEDSARRRGYQVIRAHARESALSFYRHRGYSVTGEPFTEVTIVHYYISKPLSPS